MLRRLLFVSVVLFTGALLFCATLVLVLPLEPFEGLLREEFSKRTGLVLTGGNLKKTFPLGIEATDMVISMRGKTGAELFFKRLSAGLSPLSIFTGRPRINIDGEMNQGRVDGALILGIGSQRLELELNGVGIAQFRLPRAITFTGDALFSGRIFLFRQGGGCPSGVINLSGHKLDIKRVAVMGIGIPFGRLVDAGLRADIKDCSGLIQGLWAEGEDLSVRLRGTVSYAKRPPQMDLTLDVVAKKGGAGMGPFFSLIRPYKRSANYYSIPIKGRMLF